MKQNLQLSKVITGLRCILVLVLLLIVVSVQAQEGSETEEPYYEPVEDPRMPEYIWSVAWSPDGSRIAMGFSNGDVQILDLDNPQVLTLIGHTDGLHNIVWSPQGDKLITGGGGFDNTVRIWDTASGLPLKTISEFPGDAVSALAWYPASQNIIIIYWQGNPNLFIWDTEHEITVASEKVGSGTAIQVSPNGQFAISYSLNVEIRDASFQPIRYLGVQPEDLPGEYHGEQIMDLAWSPNSQSIVTGSYLHDVTLLDVATGDIVFSVMGNEDQSGDFSLGRVVEVWFSPDGSTFNSISGDGTLRTWDTVTGQMLASSQIANPPIFAAAISPDGTRLAYADASGSVVIDTLPTPTASAP